MVSPRKDLSLVYALVILGLLSLLVFWIFCELALRFLKWVRLFAAFHRLKHAILTQIPPLRLSYVEILSSFGFVVLNILLIALPISGWERVSQRCAHMATVNLVPLLLGERLHLMGKICRIPLTLSALSHRLLGIMTVAELITHVVIMACHHHFNFHTRPDWGATLVGNPVSVE